MIGLATLDPARITVEPNPTPGSGHCAGHNGPIGSRQRLVAAVDGQLVCPACVENYWGPAAAAALAAAAAVHHARTRPTPASDDAAATRGRYAAAGQGVAAACYRFLAAESARDPR